MKLNTLKPATLSPEQVLDVLRDHYRHELEFLPDDPDYHLDFDTSVSTWRNDGDLLPCRQLADAFNDYWKMDVSYEQWRHVLKPEHKKTVRGVCELISQHANIENVRIPTLFGRSCPPAGIFFAACELLERDGADVTQLTPSSAIRPFALNHPGVFANEISRLAPGQLLPMQMDHPSTTWSCLFVISWIGMVLAWTVSSVWPALWIPIFLLVVITFVGQHIAARMKPTDVRFGNLATFRDLCKCLAPAIRT